MCIENSMKQIEAAISALEHALNRDALLYAHGQCNAFIQAAFEVEHLDQKEKQILERKVRNIYRKQITGEAA